VLLIDGNAKPMNEQHFMLGWGERLEQKHPQVRHEIARHSIVRVIQ
jgi:hypothetical protein